MAEQLRLHQVLGNRRHVQGDEGGIGARTVTVQRMGDQLLAGAGFAVDQHRDVGMAEATDGAEDLLHGRRFADDLRRRQGLRRRLQVQLLAGMLAGAADQRNGIVDVEGLGQVLEGTALVGGHGAVEVRMRRHDDDRQARMLRANLRQHVEAAGARHADVREDDVRLLGLQRAEHAIGAVETARDHAGLLQGFLQHPADGTVVIDDPDGFVLRHAPVPCSSGRKIEKAVWPGWLSHSISP